MVKPQKKCSKTVAIFNFFYLNYDSFKANLQSPILKFGEHLNLMYHEKIEFKESQATRNG